ncbi:MAG: NAD(P)H-dependent oxidoreductase [Roseibium sp.]|nr:NAD(P)H-dependent oxidoreductase [Roseibium sp.]
MKVLRLDTSAQSDSSHSRALVSRFLNGLGPDTRVIQRDLAEGVPLIGPDWFNASFTDLESRSDAQTTTLSASEELVGELQDADLLVIGMPLYNFSIPASLKLWIDQVCRANVTFRHTENGAEGLLQDKRAVIFFVSGGTRFGSEADFASDYLRFVLKFIGITDVRFIHADAHMSDQKSLSRAREEAELLSRELFQSDMTALAS